MTGDSIVRTSGQTWKLGAGFAAMVTGFGMSAYGVFSPHSADSLELAFAGIVTGSAALALTCRSVRCPTCGARWMWIALQQQHWLHWMNWMLSQTACHCCGTKSQHQDP